METNAKAASRIAEGPSGGYRTTRSKRPAGLLSTAARADRRIGRTLFIALVGGGLLVAACAATPDSSLIHHRGATEILFRPASGMQLVYHMLTSLKGTDASGKPAAGNDKSTRRLEVTRCQADLCDIRIASDQGSAPVTFQITSKGTVENILLDQAGPLSRQDDYAIGYALAQVAAFSAVYEQPWIPGETRPLMLTFPRGHEELQTILNDSVLGSVTFRRIVSFAGRHTAEFDYARSVSMPLQLRRVLRKALMTGQYWVDSETGIPIQTTGTMIATVTRNGRAEAIEVQMRDVLIFAASKGLWKRE